MGEVEFFDLVKNANRLLNNEQRIEVWDFIVKARDLKPVYRVTFEYSQTRYTHKETDYIDFDLESSAIDYIKSEGMIEGGEARGEWLEDPQGYHYDICYCSIEKLYKEIKS